MFDVTVYIWLPHAGHYGHASLQLPDGTYISWWPKDPKNLNSKIQSFGVPVDPFRSLEEDIAGEGGEHPQTYVIPVISVGNMKTWWESNRYGRKYHATSYNCCDVVIKVLKAGGVRVKSNWFYPNRPEELAGKLKAYRKY